MLKHSVLEMGDDIKALHLHIRYSCILFNFQARCKTCIGGISQIFIWLVNFWGGWQLQVHLLNTRGDWYIALYRFCIDVY